jgi:predicted dinucleotide-utilizing enzyme
MTIQTNHATDVLTASSSAGTLVGFNITNIGITDDNTTNAVVYPLWVTSTTGSLPAKVSSTKLNFNPSTGALTASQLIIAP